MAEGELILYTSPDGMAHIQLRALDGTVWLTQAEMAELFQATPQAVTQLVKAIYGEGELTPEATCKEFLQVRKEGSREVRRSLKNYSLDMILAVGYRVRSARGVQFRQWATTALKEYLVKGFVMNDERLKNPQGWDYFDELLERIREIRASEKRFYQKVRDLYATSIDYDPNGDAARTFFATVQNKMLWAVTGHTAAELIVARADANRPNMGLTAWEGGRVRKGDVATAKNYLDAEEIRELDRIVVMFLDYADDQARRRKTMTMLDWTERLDAFLSFNERPVLDHAGNVSAESAKAIAHQRFATFDLARREAERMTADRDYLDDLREIEKEAKASKGKR